MENLESILRLIYKKVSAQNVINNEIRYNHFSEEEFMRMAVAYIFQYSENEVYNMLRTYKSIFQKEQWKTEEESKDGLDVFQALNYFSEKILTIRKNEVLCRYEHLMEWRQMVMELSEDTIITAFFAGRFKPEEMLNFGFSWKQVIGTDNFQLNALMQRKISENHFHLMCSAPIFQISWLSLMNHADNNHFIKYLQEYDRNRRYSKVVYTVSFQERTLYEQYLQAVLIRLLLYSRLSGKRITIGSYYIEGDKIEKYLCFPKIYYNEKELLIWDFSSNEIFIGREENISFRSIILRFCRSWLKKENMEKRLPDDIFAQNNWIFILIEGEIGQTKLSGRDVVEIAKNSIGMSFSDFFRKIFRLLKAVPFEQIECLFRQGSFFKKLMEERTLDNVCHLLKYPEKLPMEVFRIQAIIDSFRVNEFGRYENNIPDYILNEGFLFREQDQRKKYNMVFAGERWLMYMMFQKNYSRDRSMGRYCNLFYAYLIIKERIRSELIQINSNIGFANFQRYQERKMDLLKDSIYQNILVKEAVGSLLLTENIKYIELRIMPGCNVSAQVDWIQRLDNLIDSKKKYRNKFFYTVHFSKRKEELFRGMYFYCRHYKKRQDMDRKAGMLIRFREQYPITAQRVLGIDAASSEIGCRPEVFAPSFRYLSSNICAYSTLEGKKYLPQLNITYHVGEDFLDIADGLRAIEEAILFLDMASGTRLGHALALGIDVMEWYEKKGYRLELPVQDYMDNIMWIYHKLFQYDICGFENLKESLQAEFMVLFDTVYNLNISPDEISAIYQYYQSQGMEITALSRFQNHGAMRLNMEIFTYYNAWQLRGDDPEFYKFGYFNNEEYYKTKQKCRINKRCPKEKELREVPEVAFLYYSYHYNEKIRKAGCQTKEVVITRVYARAVAEIQKAMQKKIAALGIAIETNPSSNCLVGTFRRYDKHPLPQFYNKGLVHDAKKLEQCPQISVSINTDDQGIFGTSLENEYALIACAMESLKDAQDRPLYNRDDIYEWLDNIRTMGNEQSFINYWKGDMIYV